MTVCNGPNHAVCKYANALRSTDKTDCFDMYLLGGKIDPDTLSSYIIHNNEYHNGWTYEQLGHLVRILHARTYLYKHVYNYRTLIKITERKIDAYNAQKKLEREQKLNSEKKDKANSSSPVEQEVKNTESGDEQISDPAVFLGLAKDTVVQPSVSPMDDEVKPNAISERGVPNANVPLMDTVINRTTTSNETVVGANNNIISTTSPAESDPPNEFVQSKPILRPSGMTTRSITKRRHQQ